jgi:hypothetical protein
MRVMMKAPTRLKGMMQATHIQAWAGAWPAAATPSQPYVFSTQPKPKPVRPLPMYCTPSSAPATVAAALRPPKSMEAVPESIPWTPKMNMAVKPSSTTAQSWPSQVPRPRLKPSNASMTT